MAIEIIPKKETEKPSSLALTLYYISLGLLFAVIISSGLFFFFEWRFRQERVEIGAVIEARKTPEVLALETEIGGHQRRLEDLLYLLDVRRSALPAFGVIERNMHPGVYLTGLNFNVRERRASTSGIAVNIVAYDQQVRILRDDPMIRELVVGSFTRGIDGRITFPMTITFEPGLFQ